MTVDFDNGAKETNVFRDFSDWAPWEQRKNLLDPVWNSRLAVYPGVYILAHFDKSPVGTADYLDDAIFYVGEGGHLGRRWYQFERSALEGKSGHSGGFSYQTKYGKQLWKKLHIAALPVWFGDRDESIEDWTQVYRLYVERRILWEITMKRNGRHGLLNNK